MLMWPYGPLNSDNGAARLLPRTVEHVSPCLACTPKMRDPSWEDKRRFEENAGATDGATFGLGDLSPSLDGKQQRRPGRLIRLVVANRANHATSSSLQTGISTITNKILRCMIPKQYGTILLVVPEAPHYPQRG